MYRLYRKYNRKYAYSHYASRKYVRSMSWKGTVLSTLCFIFSKYIWTAIFALNGGHGPAIAAVSLLYFADSLYIDYIFCKYTYFGKYENIEELARAGDWQSCFYVADSILVLVGSIFAVVLFGSSWHFLSVKICFLILLLISVFLVLPIFQTASRKQTLLWCILRVVFYGTVQRTGYLCILINKLHNL